MNSDRANSYVCSLKGVTRMAAGRTVRVHPGPSRPPSLCSPCNLQATKARQFIKAGNGFVEAKRMTAAGPPLRQRVKARGLRVLPCLQFTIVILRVSPGKRAFAGLLRREARS